MVSKGIKESRISLNIPAGIDDDQTISLKGEGESGLRVVRQAIYVILHIMPHAIFKQEGYDVVCDIPVSFTQAALEPKSTFPPSMV